MNYLDQIAVAQLEILAVQIKSVFLQREFLNLEGEFNITARIIFFLYKKIPFSNLKLYFIFNYIFLPLTLSL